MKSDPIEERVSRLHAGRLVDMHFDLPLGLFLKRPRRDIIATDFLPEFEAGEIGLLGVALYVEDEYLPEHGLRVALDQVALLEEELARTPRLILCRTFAEIEEAARANRIASRSARSPRRRSATSPSASSTT